MSKRARLYRWHHFTAIAFSIFDSFRSYPYQVRQRIDHQMNNSQAPYDQFTTPTRKRTKNSQPQWANSPSSLAYFIRMLLRELSTENVNNYQKILKRVSCLRKTTIQPTSFTGNILKQLFLVKKSLTLICLDNLDSIVSISKTTSSSIEQIFSAWRP